MNTHTQRKACLSEGRFKLSVFQQAKTSFVIFPSKNLLNSSVCLSIVLFEYKQLNFLISILDITIILGATAH